MIKPKTVIQRWEALIKKMAPKRPGRREAKEYAKMCLMKSIGEVRCAADMNSRGIKYIYERDTLRYQHLPQKYTADFTLIDNGDLLIEYKGKMTNDTRKKMLSVKRSNPDKRICIVFEKANNKLSSRPNSTRYWQWSESSGFEWSEGVVKSEWLEGEQLEHNNTN